jgi:hypothetical protein
MMKCGSSASAAEIFAFGSPDLPSSIPITASWRSIEARLPVDNGTPQASKRLMSAP